MIKLAWRNIWRNRRRAIITMSSVFFAVFFCVIYSSFMTGTWDKMFENMLITQAGHIQIHGKGYWDEKVVDNFMFMDAASIAQLENIDNVANVSPRVETFAMASFGVSSKGIAVAGISPEKERRKSNLPSRLVKGEYLPETDDGILIGEGLGKYLKANIGDTLALIGQGYHGASAAQLFTVRGIVKLMTAEMDNSMAYITLPSAQNFIDMHDGYSGILISIKNNNRLDETMKAISDQLSVGENNTENYDVLSWHFTMKRLLQTAESDKAFLILLMTILYLIVGFGILGTVIMMTNERIREFCLMISLGMSRMRLCTIVSVELIIKSLIGTMLAIVVTIPIVLWFNANPIQMTGEMADTLVQFGLEPILPMAVHTYLFTNQIMTILVISLLTVIYPVRKIMKLKITNG